MGEEPFLRRRGVWRQEQKTRVAKLEKQLKAKLELEELIDEQLNGFRASHNQALVLTWLKDVAQLLMPKCTAPQELAILSWFGDWRPSSILGLLYSRASSSLISSSRSGAVQERLHQILREMRIEEAIIDEEMAEIQATCVLYLPFSPFNNCESIGESLHHIQAEFKKIERVIIKAQELRLKALELVVKRVLSQTDAAEFLVLFDGIQDDINRFAEQQRLRKGPVTVPVKRKKQTEKEFQKVSKVKGLPLLGVK